MLSVLQSTKTINWLLPLVLLSNTACEHINASQNLAGRRTDNPSCDYTREQEQISKLHNDQFIELLRGQPQIITPNSIHDLKTMNKFIFSQNFNDLSKSENRVKLIDFILYPLEQQKTLSSKGICEADFRYSEVAHTLNQKAAGEIDDEKHKRDYIAYKQLLVNLRSDIRFMQIKSRSSSRKVQGTVLGLGYIVLPSKAVRYDSTLFSPVSTLNPRVEISDDIHKNLVEIFENWASKEQLEKVIQESLQRSNIYVTNDKSMDISKGAYTDGSGLIFLNSHSPLLSSKESFNEVLANEVFHAVFAKLFLKPNNISESDLKRVMQVNELGSDLSSIMIKHDAWHRPLFNALYAKSGSSMNYSLSEDIILKALEKFIVNNIGEAAKQEWYEYFQNNFGNIYDGKHLDNPDDLKQVFKLRTKITHDKFVQQFGSESDIKYRKWEEMVLKSYIDAFHKEMQMLRNNDILLNRHSLN